MPWFTDITNLHSFSNKHLLFSGVYRNSRWGLSSNINEVIRALLKSLFFYEKISHAQKTLKALKALKALKGTKTLRQKHKTQMSK